MIESSAKPAADNISRQALLLRLDIGSAYGKVTNRNTVVRDIIPENLEISTATQRNQPETLHRGRKGAQTKGNQDTTQGNHIKIRRHGNDQP